LIVYYPFSAIIALFISIMQNPRQPSAKIDLKLIADARRLFDKVYVRSDVIDKMASLTFRFEREATAAIQGPNKTDQRSQSVNKSSTVAAKPSSSLVCQPREQSNHVGITNAAEHDRQ
jgi:hypothetical protein